MQPTHGKQLVVEELEAVYDWHSFFEPLDLVIKGIAASHYHPDVNHSKRFVLRKDLCQMELPGWSLETPECLKGREHPEDVVMMCKQNKSKPPSAVLAAQVPVQMMNPNVVSTTSASSTADEDKI